jgi:hypothetical protein
MTKHDLAVAFHVLIEPNAGASLREHGYERGLADLKRIAAEIVAVEFDDRGKSTNCIFTFPALPGLLLLRRQLFENAASRLAMGTFGSSAHIKSHRFVTTSCTLHSAILRELALSADLCSAAIPLAGDQVGDFPWMVRAPAQESHRGAVASRMSLG